MPEFTAQSLAHWTEGRWTTAPSVPLTGFCVDSRQLRAGQVFVALKTDKRDGHDFLGAAQQAGAAAAIVATPNLNIDLPQLVVADPLGAFQAIAREHRRAFRGRVVGISGSAGKTSTKDLLALLLGGASCGVCATGEKLSPHRQAAESRVLATEGNLNKAGITSGASAESRVLATEGNLNKTSLSSEASTASRVLATEGNLNNHIGVPLTLTRIDPDRHDFAVVEAGISAPGEMRPLAEMIEPDVALITVIAPAHTEELGGIEGVAAEKAKLPAAVRTTGVAMFSPATAAFPAFRELGVRTLIVERAEDISSRQPPKNTVYYALTQHADSSRITLAYGAPPPLSFSFRRVSDGMAQNAALAICAALWLGISVELISSRLQAWQPARLRGEIRQEPGRLLYLDCYNANPASMADALGAFAAVAPATAPRLYVIGSMEELGADSAGYHRELGRSLPLRPADAVYFIGREATAMKEGALAGSASGSQVHIAASADEVSAVFQSWRGAIFVKGSRRYQLERVLEPAVTSAAAAGAPARAADPAPAGH